MSEIVIEQNPDLEEEKKLKIRSRRRARIFLIVVNSILGFYLVFFTGQTIVKKVTDVDKDMVQLCGLSASKSKVLYEKLFTDTYDLGDYYIYGTTLNLSQNKIDMKTYNPTTGLELVPVTKTGSDASIILQNSTTYFNEGIDLASLNVGDYILTKQGKAIKILSGTQKHKNVIYTLPNADGKRNEITVYSYPKNPCLVINVSTVKKVPDNYYDIVVACKDDVFSYVENKFGNYKIKHISSDEALSTIDSFQTSYVIRIDETNGEDNKIIASSKIHYSEFTSKNETDGLATGYDYSYFIRELGGRQLGGQLKDDSVQHSSELAQTRDEYDNGKMAFIIESPLTGNNAVDTYVSKVLTFMNTRRNLL